MSEWEALPGVGGRAFPLATIERVNGCPTVTQCELKQVVASHSRQMRSGSDPPPLKWSDLRYVFDIKEDCNGKEAIQA